MDTMDTKSVSKMDTRIQEWIQRGALPPPFSYQSGSFLVLNAVRTMKYVIKMLSPTKKERFQLISPFLRNVIAKLVRNADRNARPPWIKAVTLLMGGTLFPSLGLYRIAPNRLSESN